MVLGRSASEHATKRHKLSRSPKSGREETPNAESLCEDLVENVRLVLVLHGGLAPVRLSVRLRSACTRQPMVGIARRQDLATTRRHRKSPRSGCLQEVTS